MNSLTVLVTWMVKSIQTMRPKMSVEDHKLFFMLAMECVMDLWTMRSAIMTMGIAVRALLLLITTVLGTIASVIWMIPDSPLNLRNAIMQNLPIGWPLTFFILWTGHLVLLSSILVCFDCSEANELRTIEIHGNLNCPYLSFFSNLNLQLFRWTLLKIVLAYVWSSLSPLLVIFWQNIRLMTASPNSLKIVVLVMDLLGFKIYPIGGAYIFTLAHIFLWIHVFCDFTYLFILNCVNSLIS